MLAVTSLSTNTPFWFNVRPEGPNFFALNMGLCLPFALGLSVAFPKRKIISIDSDGSLMNDSSSLITVADVNPANLVAFVMDNGSYAFMGSTFTTRKTDLAKMAQGAGIANTSTVKTLENFLRQQTGDGKHGPTFIVAKVERDAGRCRLIAAALRAGRSENGSWTRSPPSRLSRRSLTLHLNYSTREFLMKRFDCLKLLAPLVDEHMLTVTSLSSNTAFWSDLRREGASFFGCNMGLCIPFALGLTAAFPKRKVIALDSDGSLMVDTSSLITVADVNPPNFVAIVMDHGSYARMGSTFTTRKTDLEKIAQGAGIVNTVTVRSEEALSAAARHALESSGPHFIVAKVEPDRVRVKGDPHRTYGRFMRECFVDAVRHHPDYQQAKK